ncbi:uncharacterized protein PFLUO_LOCUS6782 [Penicillium psychrofluorescens]|uniref:uncharacterized protein n=1 Tax=Penicillium psychrofluorescens TaxID=3158075 RepID=UPI003CCE10CB
MRGTSVFQFKGWPKIHQPLPRTPRESQQLLSALTSSFRRQLDRAYPASDSTREHNDDQTPPNNAESSAHATSQHLRNILENPLFRIVPSQPTGIRETQQRRLAEQPMVVFDELVAFGLVTVEDICQCLESQLRLAHGGTETNVTEDVKSAMKTSRAGSKVVDWFSASSLQDKKVLLRTGNCTSPLTKFMVVEGLHGNIMEWLRMLLVQDLGGGHGSIKPEAAHQAFNFLLLHWMKAERQYGHGLSSALRYYVQVCQMHSSVSDPITRKTLISSGAHLGQIAEQQTASAEKIPAFIYDEFQDAISTLTPGSLLSARMALGHPTQPDPQPFIRYVRSLDYNKTPFWRNSRRVAFLDTGFKAVQVLIDRAKIKDATFVAHHLQSFLPDKMISDTSDGPQYHASPEQTSLLNRLGMSLT